MKKIKNEITAFRPGPVVLEKGASNRAKHFVDMVGIPVARSGKGARSTDRNNSSPRNNPQKYSMEQVIPAGSQLRALPPKVVQVRRIVQSKYLDLMQKLYDYTDPTTRKTVQDRL